MSTTKPMTAADLLALPDDGWRYELIEGVLHRMPPAGGEHGEIETAFIIHMGLHVATHRTGKVYPGDTGFFFSHEPEIILVPDVAFVRTARLPPPSERTGLLNVIPDLVVEIVSPSDRRQDVVDKVALYLAHGVPLVWVAYPKTRTVVAHRPGQEPQTFGSGDVLEADDIVPGFRLPVAEIFR